MGLYERLINEITYSGVMNKQRSITRLFPTFYKRVNKVKQAGRITLVDMYPDVWLFVAPSSSGQGNYDLHLHFKDIEKQLEKFVPNRKLWNEDETGVDYNKLGPEVMNQVNLEMDCTCPADLYYGPEYIKTQRQAQFGPPENRPPKIRNPKEYGIICKHQQALMDKLPSYNFTFNGFLKKFYGKEIEAIFNRTIKLVGGIKKVAGELKGKEKPEEQPQRFGRGGRVIEEPPTEVEPKIEKLAPEIVKIIDEIPEDMSKMMQGELQKTLKKYNIKPEDYLKYLEEQK
jgi:hypothetical protein